MSRSPHQPPPGRSLRAPFLAAAALLFGVVGAGLTSLGGASAESFDPTAPLTVAVGEPAGNAVRPRLDAERSGLAATLLPVRPVQRWRRDLAGGLDHPPVVLPDGGIVAALALPDVECVNRDGTPRWRLALRSAQAALPPVITGDGNITIITRAAELIKVTPDGTIARRITLDLDASKAEATPLALDDGSLVVAGTRELLRLDSAGGTLARADIPGRPVGGLLRRGRAFLITTSAGEVLQWQPPGLPRVLGEFGGRPRGGALLAGQDTLVAAIDGRSLLALDLRSGKTTPLISTSDALAQLEGPPALSAKQVLFVTTAFGELIGLDAHGSVVRRGAVDNLALLTGRDGGAPLPSIFRRAAGRPSPPLLLDMRGTIAFVRASGSLGIIDPAGNLQIANARFCSQPIGVFPAGEHLLGVACRSGALAVFGNPAP